MKNVYDAPDSPRKNDDDRDIKQDRCTFCLFITGLESSGTNDEGLAGEL